MIDIEIVNFYNSVRDPSWPDVSSYHDFHRLPEHIKQECNDLHQFQLRKKQICDLDYWANKTVDVCVYKDFAYVPIPKCAYTYYTTLFTNVGWKKVPLQEVDIDNTKFFGLLMHPLERRLKGITEWLTESHAKNDHVRSVTNPWITEKMDIDWDELHKTVNTKYFKMLLKNMGFGDIHSSPYHVIFGSFINRVNWIPMDTMSQPDTLSSMIKFLKLHGCDVELPLDQPPLHVSSKNKLQLYNVVKDTFNNSNEDIYQLYRLYAQDLNFYYNLVDNFTPDWQHLKK